MQISAPPSPRQSLSGDDRVRLLPHLIVLRRDDHDIQLGVDADDAVVLADPDGTVTRLLELLDGRCRLAELTTLATQRDLPGELVEGLVATLAERGLLQTPEPSTSARAEVRLVGGCEVATAVGEQLLRAGVGRLLVADPLDAPWHPSALVARDRVQRLEHWSQPEIGAVQLTVLVATTLEVDRAVTTALTAADHPHLLVRPAAHGAVVGPLVIPGRTGCVRCGDLSRTRTDPAWPLLLAQLCRTRSDWKPAAADWAAAVATTQILAQLAGRTVETASATLELGADWSWQRRVWPADPACGCSWAPRAEW